MVSKKMISTPITTISFIEIQKVELLQTVNHKKLKDTILNYNRTNKTHYKKDNDLILIQLTPQSF